MQNSDLIIIYFTLQRALSFVENENLDAAWVETTYAHLCYKKCPFKEMYVVYRSIGLEACNLGRRKFILKMFVENGLINEAVEWARANCKDGFEPECIAFILKGTY